MKQNTSNSYGRRTFLKTSALLVSAGLVSDQAEALAGPNPDGNSLNLDRLALATLRVVNRSGTGSAVPFARRDDTYYALTAEHVGAGIVEHFTYSSYPRPAARYRTQMVAANRTRDVAIVRFQTSDRLPLLQLRSELSLPPTRFTGAWAGCAFGNAPAARDCVVLGDMQCRVRGCQGIRWATYPSPTSGISGGPLVDQSGSLIGIASTGSMSGIGGFCHLTDIHMLAQDAGLMQPAGARQGGRRRVPDDPLVETQDVHPGACPCRPRFPVEPEGDRDFSGASRRRLILVGPNGRTMVIQTR